MRPRCAGFTVVELMVVMALLVVLAGGAGLALQQGNDGIALQAGQAMLAHSLAAVRAQAALTGRNAALAIPVDPTDPEYFLRSVLTVARDSSDNAWVPVGGRLSFPSGVALLPPTVPAGEWVRAGADWSGLASTALGAQPVVVGAGPVYLLVYTPRGTISGGGGDLVLATLVQRPPGKPVPFVYVAPEAVRGLSVSSYGVATWIHRRDEF